MKAAKEGTKDGLEKTKAAVKRGRSFIRTKSFISQGLWPRKPSYPLTGAPCASSGSSHLVSLGGHPGWGARGLSQGARSASSGQLSALRSYCSHRHLFTAQVF